jgi:hypothetical protein
MNGTKTQNRWILAIIGGAIPVLIILSLNFDLTEAVFVPLVILLVFIFFSTALWFNANDHADGAEWWQDDEASGWRGY